MMLDPAWSQSVAKPPGSALRVLVVTPNAERAEGVGGDHRTFQVLQDARAAAGPFNTQHVWLGQLPVSRTEERPLWRMAGEKARDSLLFRWGYASENLWRFPGTPRFGTRAPMNPAATARYEQTVASLDGEAVCVLEDIGLGRIREINERYGVPTILCPQNLESMAQNLPDIRRWASGEPGLQSSLAVGLDVVREIQAIARYSACLPISRVETTLLRGLGLNAEYYPYVPAGEVRERCLRLRSARQESAPDPQRFLLLGSASYYPTRISFEWFLDNVRRYGLPRGIHVVIAGHETDSLEGAHDLPGVEVRGWVKQAELDDLLARVGGALVPQQLGFGALTRVPEQSCSGIPQIATPVAVQGLNTPPGVQVVDGDWDAWQAAMCEVAEGIPGPSETDYRAWEAAQPNTLQRLLESMSQAQGGAEQA